MGELHYFHFRRFGCFGERLGPQLAANAVLFTGLALPLSMSARCPLWVDCVEKVGSCDA